MAEQKAAEAATYNEVSGSAAAGVVVQTGSVSGGIHVHGSPRPAVVPRQLPAAPARFTGRGCELDRLTAVLEEGSDAGPTVVVSAIGGTGGVGKTSLALRWAHEHLERFPDGQLHINLHGFDPVSKPVPAETAVRAFLDALGVAPGLIPLDPGAQAALYRSLLVGKRILIVLDNARDTPQVTPLLPGTSTCTVLVTSRNHLTGLIARGAHLIDLDILADGEDRMLLSRHLGEDRIAAEPRAVTELLAHCAGLPLALSIVAARAGCQPALPLAVLAEELHEATERLDALNGGDLDTDLRVVMICSLQALGRAAADAFRLLALAPGPDISLPAAASITATSPAKTRQLLRELEIAHLVHQYIPGRYRMHDLVRLFAAERARQDLAQQDCTMALRRLIDFYLHSAHAGSQIIYPHKEPRIILEPPLQGVSQYPLTDVESALHWFDAEHPCLLATHNFAIRERLHLQVYQLAWSLDTFHERRHHAQEQFSAWQAGLMAARCLGSSSFQIEADRRLGNACSRLGKHTEAFNYLEQALTLANATADLPSQALTHISLGAVWGEQGDERRALGHSLSALVLYESLHQWPKVAHALNNAGYSYAKLGDYEQAQSCCSQALTLARHHGNHPVEANTLHSLGYIAHRTGLHARALRYFEEALAMYRVNGDSYAEAEALEDIGSVWAVLAHLDQARLMWRESLMLYTAQRRNTEAARVQHQLSVPPPVPDAVTALIHTYGVPPEIAARVVRTWRLPTQPVEARTPLSDLTA
ncbi:tetratricopeptide repeat protein [Streptomyces sp. NPDC050732]|uniref:ATP-binding protein n=1 Tax=Streptomyces sp. NPDC050732 TaxID=3154632 RepID=UPI0034391F76